ncbi:MAG: hypothetical protein R3247_13050 [Rhodothermales bacterium]|nr:hypothetical protein [Rhodothermales bacterium]
MTQKEMVLESTAFVAAVAVAAGTAAGTVALARGETPGAPGISKALSRLGHAVGGSMLSGVAFIGATSALVSLAVYQGLRQLDF